MVTRAKSLAFTWVRFPDMIAFSSRRFRNVWYFASWTVLPMLSPLTGFPKYVDLQGCCVCVLLVPVPVMFCMRNSDLVVNFVPAVNFEPQYGRTIHTRSCDWCRSSTFVVRARNLSEVPSVTLRCFLRSFLRRVDITDAPECRVQDAWLVSVLGVFAEQECSEKQSGDENFAELCEPSWASAESAISGNHQIKTIRPMWDRTPGT